MTRKHRILARAERAQKASHKLMLYILAGELRTVRDTGPVED